MTPAAGSFRTRRVSPVPQVVGYILLVGLAIFAIKLALIFLLLAGLIFRTKETVGLLLLGAILYGFKAYPLISVGLAAVLLGVSLYFKRKEKLAGGTKLVPGPDD